MAQIWEMNREYKELLHKFAGNEDIYKLIELAILDNERLRALYYSKNFKYPEQQDIADKIMIDLKTVRYMSNVKK